jgi:FdhD protein
VAAEETITVVRADGTTATQTRLWVPETPVALEFNGIAYAVMMATPADLADFATGFALAEALIATADQIAHIAPAEVADGWILRAQIRGPGADRIMDRVRTRVAESSCGLCGIENLAEVTRALPPVAAHAPIAAAAIFAALAALRPLQALGRATAAAHAAALCTPTGTIALLREDVGRHNAMDKLIGAALRAARPLGEGFVLSTARCSYEIVEKAVRAGATTLVTVSLPTAMAVTRARAAGLSLWVLAREDAVLQV